MVSKARLRILVAASGACLASAIMADALHRHLWINCVLSGLAIAFCLGALAGLKLSDIEDLPARDDEHDAGLQPLAVLVEQVPIPLLKFSQAKGLCAVNRAARSLFNVDDLITDVPALLVDEISRATLGSPSTLILFGRTYAIGVSEIITSEETLRLISLADIQSEVRMAEATALRDLLRVLSHEIMNSLTPVANLAGIAHDYLEGETSDAAYAARDALSLLSQRAGGLASFIEAYRSLARLPDPVLQPVRIALLLKDVIRVFEQTLCAGVSMELNLPEEAPIIEVDEALLTQALLNVLTNASEAIAKSAQGRIGIALSVDRKEIRIHISDTGCGVPDTLAEQMFHAFITTKPSGTGTGLNLARQIALAHGGDLLFLGSEGIWSSVFSFSLQRLPGDVGRDM